MNIVGVLSGKRKCLLAIAIAFSTFGNAQLVTYPEGLNTGMPHNDDYTVKVREAGGEWKDVFEYEVQVDMDLRGSIQNVAWTKCRTKYVKPLVHR